MSSTRRSINRPYRALARTVEQAANTDSENDQATLSGGLTRKLTDALAVLSGDLSTVPTASFARAGRTIVTS
jgi:hypothetical protein